VVHKLPADLRQALIANGTALDAWNDITPLARNEFICWVEDAKQETTRAQIPADREARIVLEFDESAGLLSFDAWVEEKRVFGADDWLG
jgi:hypothetical protein